MTRQSIKQFFLDNPKKVLILDGGQGTELERRGINVANPVWSTIPFISESFWSDEKTKDRKIVEEVFEDFLAAGADILMTITYQTSLYSVLKHTPISTLNDYNKLLNRIVSFTRECIGPDKYLIGCIGPWGAHICAEFNGDYGLHPEKIDYYGYFKPQLENFNRNDDVDLIGFETIPNMHELKEILSWDEKVLCKPFYIGLSVHDNGVLRDGSSLKEVASLIKSMHGKVNPNLLLLGINCVSFNNSPEILESLHREIPDLPLIVYPNSGEVYDTVKKIWSPNNDKSMSWKDVVRRCIKANARIIGGCCRTTPEDIKEIASAVLEMQEAEVTAEPS